MKLLVRADASGQIGTGHVMRCLALCEAWLDAGGIAVLAAAELPDALATRLTSAGIALHSIVAEPGSAADAAATAATAAAFGADWVLLDGYSFTETFHQTLKGQAWRLAAIDDLGTLAHYAVDLLLNPNLHADMLPYARLAPRSRLLLGCRYALLRREFAQWQGPPRHYPQPARTLLVLVGGADPHDHLTLLLEALTGDGGISLDITAVIGPANPRGAALTASFGATLRLLAARETLAAEFCAADLVLSSAGSTVWELARLGAPMLLGATVPGEEINAQRVAAAGAARALGPFARCTPDAIRREVTRLAQDGDSRRSLGTAAAALVDGQGAARVVAEMRALSKEPRTRDGCILAARTLPPFPV